MPTVTFRLVEGVVISIDGPCPEIEEIIHAAKAEVTGLVHWGDPLTYEITAGSDTRHRVEVTVTGLPLDILRAEFMRRGYEIYDPSRRLR